MMNDGAAQVEGFLTLAVVRPGGCAEVWSSSPSCHIRLNLTLINWYSLALSAEKYRKALSFVDREQMIHAVMLYSLHSSNAQLQNVYKIKGSCAYPGMTSLTTS